MTVFASKIDRLAETVKMAVGTDIAPLATSLASGSDRLAVAVGSGGSLVSADYLAVCRRDFQGAPTLVQTPMEFILATEDLQRADVWLFSARGENPDIKGAYRAALKRGAGRIMIVTWNAESALAKEARESQKVQIYLVPIADPDAFLASHSLVSVMVALLRASDAAAKPKLRLDLAGLETEAVRRTGTAFRAEMASRFQSVKTTDALIVIADPRLSSIARVLETSLWEASLCAVQWTDYRNFAHGRNVWITRHPDRSFILGLTGESTRPAWDELMELIPGDIRGIHIDYQDCGWLQNLLGVLDGLVIIEALGLAVGIDPGKPGAAPFSTPHYYQETLERLAQALPPR